MTRIALPLILSALLLAACNTYGTHPLPKEAYTCKEWPAPIKGVYGWRETADYIVRGKSAYSDCRAKLDALSGE